MIKFIFSIFAFLLFSFFLPVFSHDYYAVPSGWEKVCEFDNNYGLQLKSSKNQLYFHNIGQYSQDNGKTFRNIKLFPYISESSINFIDGKFHIYLYNPGWGGTQSLDLQNYQDTIINFRLIRNNCELLPVNYKCNSYNYETMIVKIKDLDRYQTETDILFISKDFGKTWKKFENIPKSKSHIYTILYDLSNANKWLIKSVCDINGFGCIDTKDYYYITEDNGLNFKEIQIEDFGPWSLVEKDFIQYFTVNNGTRHYFTKKNYNYYSKSDSLNQLVISNVFDKNMKTILSLDSIVADYSKLSNVPENSVNFSNIYFYTNDKGMIFQTIDQAKYLNKDTTSVKLMYFDCPNQKVNVWQDFEIPLIPNEKNYSLPRILDYDKETGFVYVELCQPIAGYQKRVVIRKQIGTANSVESNREITETITASEGRIILTKQFDNPEIQLIDLLGKKVEFKIVNTLPLTLELNSNQSIGLYFLQIKDNLKQSNYKLMVRD